METHIPEDIIVMILLGLPVKSLLQFKSVCKNWYNLIESRDFVAKHSHYQKCNNRGRVLLSMQDECNNCYILHDSETIGGSTYDNFEKFDLSKLDFVSCEKNSGGWLLCAPVKGLCCITKKECDQIIIWNPASKKYRALPLPNVLNLNKERCHSVGFGLEHTTGDCKLVLTLSASYDNKLYVYSLRKNSWKTLLVTNREVQFGWLLKSVGEHSNGVCYWLGRNQVVVYTFDLSKESLGLIKIRTSCDPMRSMLTMVRRCELATRDDRLLFVIFTIDNDNTPYVHTSTLDSEEVVCVQHMCTVKGCHFGGDVRLWKNKEDFCIVYSTKLYNVTTKEELKQFGKGKCPQEAHIYYESLESVKGGETTTRTAKPF